MGGACSGIRTRQPKIWDVTGHCPHCGEPVMLVPISPLVAGALHGCPCDAEPTPRLGPRRVCPPRGQRGDPPEEHRCADRPPARGLRRDRGVRGNRFRRSLSGVPEPGRESEVGSYGSELSQKDDSVQPRYCRGINARSYISLCKFLQIGVRLFGLGVCRGNRIIDHDFPSHLRWIRSVEYKFRNRTGNNIRHF